jgi:hypothetical protein
VWTLRRDGPIAFVVLAVAIFALAAYGLLTERHNGSRQLGAGLLLPPKLRPEILAVPRGVHLSGARDVLASSDPLAGATTLWILRRNGGVLAVQRGVLSRNAARLIVQPTFVLRVSGDVKNASFQIDRWNSRLALFEIRSKAHGVGIRVFALDPPRLILDAVAPVAPQVSPVARRSLLIATWSGRQPDLFVLDSGSPSGRASVSAFSGESHFHSQILPIRWTPPFAGRWTFAIVNLGGSRPDLVGITRFPETGTGFAEAHILSGATGFRAFLLHSPLGIPAAESTDGQIGVLPAGVVYVFDPRHPDRIKVMRLPAGS